MRACVYAQACVRACVYVCTVLLPPGVNPIAVNKYIISYHNISYIRILICYLLQFDIQLFSVWHLSRHVFLTMSVIPHLTANLPTSFRPFVEQQHFPCCDHWLQLCAVSLAGSPLSLCWTISRLCCELITGISARVCT